MDIAAARAALEGQDRVTLHELIPSIKGMEEAALGKKGHGSMRAAEMIVSAMRGEDLPPDIVEVVAPPPPLTPWPGTYGEYRC